MKEQAEGKMDARSFNAKEDSDLTVILLDETLHLHWMFLKGRSPVFSRMRTAMSVNKVEKSAETLDLTTNQYAPILKPFFLYFYTEGVQEGRLGMLWAVGHNFEVADLQDDVQQQLNQAQRLSLVDIISNLKCLFPYRQQPRLQAVINTLITQAQTQLQQDPAQLTTQLQTSAIPAELFKVIMTAAYNSTTKGHMLSFIIKRTKEDAAYKELIDQLLNTKVEVRSEDVVLVAKYATENKHKELTGLVTHYIATNFGDISVDVMMGLPESIKRAMIVEAQTVRKVVEQDVKNLSDKINNIEGQLAVVDFGMENIAGWLPEGKKIGAPLYQATRDGFAPKDFHDRCDNQGPTVVVIRSKHLVFGGFASASWCSDKSGQWSMAIKAPESFLFTLKSKNGIEPTKLLLAPGSEDYALCVRPDGTPCFGADLTVLNNAHSEEPCAFPRMYKDPTGQGNALFCDSNHRVTAQEIVVFRVV